MDLPSLLVEFKSQQFRMVRHEDYDHLLQAIRFHFASIKADDTIRLETNDLSTCHGQWVDIAGPIWPFVQSSLQRLRVIVEPASARSTLTPSLMVHVELQGLGRTIALRTTRSANTTSLEKMLQEAGVAIHPCQFSLNGARLPPDASMFTCGLQNNSTLVLTRSTGCEQLTGPVELAPVQIFVRTLTGKTIVTQVKLTDTIDSLGRIIEEREGIPQEHQRLLFGGRQLDNKRILADFGINKESLIHLILGLKGAKPVIYVFPPAGMCVEAHIRLSLVPEWAFSAIYPVVPGKAGPAGGQNLTWTVKTLPDGSLRETKTETDVSYLYWEADTTAVGVWSPPPSPQVNGSGQAIERFIPNRPSLDDSNSILVSLCELTPYLDKVLLAMGLHTEARTSFITYWLPSFNKHKHIALRFLPQGAYEKAAPLDVQPKPDVVARIFMLFQGIEDADLGSWSGATQRFKEPVEFWAGVVGIDKARVLDQSSFRVIEWGGMEVRN